MRLPVTLLIALSLLFACSNEKPTGPGSGEVTLTLNQTEYEAGDTIILTLANSLDRPVYVGICPGAEPEQQNHASWEPVWPPPEVCIDILPPELAAGSTMTLHFDALSQKGVYRFRQVVFDDAAALHGRAVYSKPFRVR